MRVIGIDGIDGAGKTTLIKELKDRFECKGLDVATITTLGSTQYGSLARYHLLHSKREQTIFDRLSMLVLNEMTVGQAIDSYKEKKVDVLLLDRTGYSVYAYNPEIASLEYFDLLGLVDSQLTKLDNVFFLDLPVNVARSRHSDKKKDNVESKSNEFFEGVRDRFLEVSKTNKVTVVNAEQTTDDMISNIINTIEKKGE